MLNRFLIVVAAAVLFWLILQWTKSKDDETAYDDYSNPKPPLYVYYNSSGIDIPMYLYFFTVGVLSIVGAMLVERLLDNGVAAVMVMFIIAFAGKQNVVIRSIRNGQAIDNDSPGFLSSFGNILHTVDNPIFALGQSYRHANVRYRRILSDLHVRLENGQDPYIEIERAKRFFRNRILRNFLDDYAEHLIRGGILNVSLERLITRAEDRKQHAIERKVETYTGIVVIYGGIIFEVVLTTFIAIVRPDWMQVFTNSPLGQVAVWGIVAVTGFMILIAQRLILLSEG